MKENKTTEIILLKKKRRRRRKRKKKKWHCLEKKNWSSFYARFAAMITILDQTDNKIAEDYTKRTNFCGFYSKTCYVPHSNCNKYLKI